MDTDAWVWGLYEYSLWEGGGRQRMWGQTEMKLTEAVYMIQEERDPRPWLSLRKNLREQTQSLILQMKKPEFKQPKQLH